MNPHLAHLSQNYLFPEIARRIGNRKVIDLGVGDTKRPLPHYVAERMAQRSLELATKEGYCGYGPPFGLEELRQKIASVIYQDRLDADEIFISDGAKSDLARLMHLFAPRTRIEIQQPAYPAFVEAATIAGHIVGAEDLILLCSPNNPTGELADFDAALARGLPVINDAAYAAYITSDAPKSIFEVEGARNLAIEVGSFSKLAGFTGVRLGWTAIAKENPFYTSWKRILSTLFNGASIISQAGGIACLEPKGWDEIQKNLAYYKENARILNGGEPTNAPYVWREFPGRSSWEVFDELLELGIAATPGVGFGSTGEGFIRFSAFASRKEIISAAQRLPSTRAIGQNT